MTLCPSLLWAPEAKGPNGDDHKQALVCFTLHCISYKAGLILVFGLKDFMSKETLYTLFILLLAVCSNFIFSHFWTQPELCML